MKTFFALSLLASSIPSLVVRCGFREDPNVKILIDQLHLQLDMVNKDSFVPESARQDGVGTIGASNAPHTTKKNIPYAAFFRESSSVQQKTKNVPLFKMTGIVMTMISSLGPTDVSWGDWLSSNDANIKGCLELALDALDSDVGCDKEERLWAVGILAAILNYLPPDADEVTAEQKFQTLNWSNQVSLEIQATNEYEPYMSQKFKSIVKKDDSTLGVHISPELEETLARAEILGRHDDERRKKYPCLQTNIYKIISPYLLKTKLPESEKEIGNLMREFRALFKKMLLSDWEGNYALDIFQHLLHHSFPIRDTFQKNLRDYEFFRDMHLPFAKKDVEEILEKHERDFNSIYLESLKQAIRHWNLQEERLPHKLNSLESMLGTESASVAEAESLVYIHRLMIALSLINRDDESQLMLKFKKGAKSRHGASIALRKIWSALCPDGLVKEGRFGEYQWFIVMKDPSFLQMAKIFQRASDMRNSKSHSIQQMGIILEEVLHTHKSQIQDKVKEYFAQVFVNLKTISNLSPEKSIYKMDLLSIHNLIQYNVDCSGPFLVHLQNSKEDRMVLNTAVMHIIKRGLVEDDLAKAMIPDVEGGQHVARSSFGKFLITLLDILDQMNTPGYTMGHQAHLELKKKLGQKFDTFHLSVGGQAFPFEFN